MSVISEALSLVPRLRVTAAEPGSVVAEADTGSDDGAAGGGDAAASRITGPRCGDGVVARTRGLARGLAGSTTMVDRLLAAWAEAGADESETAENAIAAHGNDSSEVDSNKDRRKPADRTDDMTKLTEDRARAASSWRRTSGAVRCDEQTRR
ncbi:hypothetical protein [Rhodopseudomonas palustris]|uniref:hypothetical protein n=1 Tax=Rhodopseudomonas palustris TaxID=1076 RepID=UPI0021F2B3CD|nr:hypothetical protein [Rhodopseudomonas palustris]